MNMENFRYVNGGKSSYTQLHLLHERYFRHLAQVLTMRAQF